ncbi:MAG TPA: CvpA family protein [Acidimicrobiia bacterium]|nr:CvpA family protein [Acidimicrobiia bacterium]
MLDFVLGLVLAGLLVRGWTRGFVREALDLVGLILGVWVAFRVSGPLGEFLTDRFGVAPEVAGVGAGIVLFVLLGVSLSVVARYLSKVMNLPGLTLINRVGGAAVAMGWGVVIVLVLINLAGVLPLPEGWDKAVEDSVVAQAIAGPDALPQQAFESVGSSQVLASLTAIQSVLGSSRAVPEGNEIITIPGARADEIRQVRDEAAEAMVRINEYRAGQGLGALTSSAVFTEVAESRAAGMYITGRISRDTPPGGSVLDDLATAGVRPASAGENLALASSARAALDGMLESPTATAQFNVPTYDRAGVAVVDGPTGRLVVVVLGG